jgi:hypothetical protein
MDINMDFITKKIKNKELERELKILEKEMLSECQIEEAKFNRI